MQPLNNFGRIANSCSTLSIQRSEHMLSCAPFAPTVLIVTSDLQFGGAQRQIVELCNNMSRERYRIHVCSLSDYVPLLPAIAEREKRFDLVLRRSRFDWTVVPRLAALIRKLNAALVHGFLFDAEISSRLAGRFTGRPVIGSERNANYSLKRSDYVAYKLTSWAVDLTIANSTAGADFNHKLFKLPRKSYRVIHNGVDSLRFQPRIENTLRAELGLTGDDLVIGIFGSFKPQKNQPMLLAAARTVLDRVPQAKFMFVGDELHHGQVGSIEFKERVKSMVAQLGLASACRFVGNQSDVERYYNMCDLTALPSLFEGTPNVALESMASGVPVVATEVSDNAYIIPDGRVGFLVPSGDAGAMAERICCLLGNPEKRKAFGNAGRDWILTEFTPARLAEKTAAVYDEALGRKH
jgi:glycosyltransferase involved in cell wall biosynthesis